jgi:uncharacterized damage-inducible protein DinB
MRKHFVRLYHYNIWANQLFAQVLAESDFKNEKVNELFAHIANAQYIWLDRINSLDIAIPSIFEVPDLKKSIEMVASSSQLWLEFIQNVDDFDKTIAYNDTKGVARKSKLDDIFTHVANHGTHHRGQIATLLRQENIAPPASDYIFFSRV